MTLRIRVIAAALAATAVGSAAAQTGDEFVPVTDEMLQKPDPGDWLMWRRTLERLGLQPARADRQAQRREARSRSGRTPMGTGIQEVDAAGLRRRDVRAEPRRLRAGVRRADRRAALGVSAPVPRRRARRHESQPRDLGHDADRRRRRQLDVRDRRAHRQARVGDAGARADAAARARARARSSPTARSSRAGNASPTRRTKRASSRRTTPRPARSCGARARFRAGEPGDETWGDVPMEQRWHVGTWMVPSYDPELDRIYIGTSVTIPAPKFILGGVDKQHLYHNSTLALEPGRRQDRLVLPASDRPLGSRSSVRALARRHGRRAGSERGRVDQSAPAARRAAQGDHGHSRQDRHRLHARSRDGRVPVGAARRSIRTWSRTSTARRARSTVDPERVFTQKGPDADRVPRHERR